MTKHSPGPWTHGVARMSLLTGDVQEWGAFGAGEEIALVHRPNNARLIAAAPEMLALLRKVTANLRAAIESEGLPTWLDRDGVLAAEALLERLK